MGQTFGLKVEGLPHPCPSGEGVLIPEVKKATGLGEVSRQVWRNIVDHALDGTEYEVHGRRFKLAA